MRPAQNAIVLGSGNLGLIYLMERPHRLDARGDPASSTPS